MKSLIKSLLWVVLFVCLPTFSFAAGNAVEIGGIRIEFIIFALTLVGVALFHHQTMYVALGGLTALLIVKYASDTDFSMIHHLVGDASKEGEWKTLLNLVGLLFGFGILAKVFEESGIPEKLPDILPDDWKGGFVLLLIIMIMSSFLDNIAAAMIGGTIALVVFKHKVHLGFVAAIIAASNAGGAGSVVGDTTTTIMWIDGVNPFDVVHAFIAAFGAFLVFGIIGSIQQHRYQPIQKDSTPGIVIEHKKLIVVVLILIGAIMTNYFLDFPALGVWLALLLGATFTSIPWGEVKSAVSGTVFLTALVTCASLMPVEDLPAASWQTAFSLGFISSIFDNIPLTKLCLDQGGYDWGVLAYAVGFGGSMLWFGSSAGVALTSKFEEARSVGKYLRYGWHVTIAYVVGFFLLHGTLGWHPHAPHRSTQTNTEVAISQPIDNHGHAE